MPRILLVDDDAELADLVGQYLRRENFEVEWVGDGATGAERALESHFDLIVLDVMLPAMSGLEVLSSLRGGGCRVPIVMLTARGDEVDRVVGLELGADDYLAKPFSSRELVARIRAVLRRAREASGDAAVLRAGEISANASTREARRDVELLDLTGAEFDLLFLLLQNVGKVVTRETISQTVLDRALLSTDRSVDVHVSNLRRKLGPASDGGERIKTLRGVGYLYVKA